MLHAVKGFCGNTNTHSDAILSYLAYVGDVMSLDLIFMSFKMSFKKIGGWGGIRIFQYTCYKNQFLRAIVFTVNRLTYFFEMRKLPSWSLKTSKNFENIFKTVPKRRFVS